MRQQNEDIKEVWADLTGSFVGSHLQADGGLVIGFIRLGLWIVQVPPGSVGGHSSLTRTLVGPHLEKETSNTSVSFFLLYINGKGSEINSKPTVYIELEWINLPMSQWVYFSVQGLLFSAAYVWPITLELVISFIMEHCVERQHGHQLFWSCSH